MIVVFLDHYAKFERRKNQRSKKMTIHKTISVLKKLGKNSNEEKCVFLKYLEVKNHVFLF